MPKILRTDEALPPYLHKLKVIFRQWRISDAVFRVRIAVIFVFIDLYRRIIPKFVTSHHLNVHLDSPAADTLDDTLILIQCIAASLYEFIECPPAVAAAKAIVNSLVTDKRITVYRHKYKFFTNLSNYILMRNKTAHHVIYFASSR